MDLEKDLLLTVQARLSRPHTDDICGWIALGREDCPVTSAISPGLQPLNALEPFLFSQPDVTTHPWSEEWSPVENPEARPGILLAKVTFKL